MGVYCVCFQISISLWVFNSSNGACTNGVLNCFLEAVKVSPPIPVLAGIPGSVEGSSRSPLLAGIPAVIPAGIPITAGIPALHKTCNKACDSKVCKRKACKGKACKSKACKGQAYKGNTCKTKKQLPKTKLAKAKLAKAKLANPTLTLATLPTTTKLAKHCLGSPRRCHGFASFSGVFIC